LATFLSPQVERFPNLTTQSQSTFVSQFQVHTSSRVRSPLPAFVLGSLRAALHASGKVVVERNLFGGAMV
jgi:hypothetical protein